MSATLAPAHVLSFAHSTPDQAIDRPLDCAGRDATACPSPFTVVNDSGPVLFKVGVEIAQMSSRHACLPFKIRQFRTDPIKQIAKPIKGLTKFGFTATPKVTAQIGEPIIKLKDGAVRRKPKWRYPSETLVGVPHLHGNMEIIKHRSRLHRNELLQSQQRFGAVRHERCRSSGVGSHSFNKPA